MTDEIQEQISALLDDEVSDRDASAVIDRLREQDDLRQTWGRYHLIGDVIRGEAGSSAYPDIASSVRERIKSEPAILAAPQPVMAVEKKSPSWTRPLAGAALAASVAVVTVMAAPHLIGLGTGSGMEVAGKQNLPAVLGATPSTAIVQVAAPAEIKGYSGRPGTRWKNLAIPAVESKLDSYLVNHSEYAAQGGMQGVMPYATFINYHPNHNQ